MLILHSSCISEDEMNRFAMQHGFCTSLGADRHHRQLSECHCVASDALMNLITALLKFKEAGMFWHRGAHANTRTKSSMQHALWPWFYLQAHVTICRPCQHANIPTQQHSNTISHTHTHACAHICTHTCTPYTKKKKNINIHVHMLSLTRSHDSQR